MYPLGTSLPPLPTGLFTMVTLISGHDIRPVRRLADHGQQLSSAQLGYTEYCIDGRPKCKQQILYTACLRAVFSQ